MLASMPLGLRPRPGEPAHGVLLRLAARNGYSSTRVFAASLGLDLREVLRGHHVGRIAGLAGLEADEVRSASPRISMPARKLVLESAELDLRDWSTRRRRACIACLSDDTALADKISVKHDGYVSHRAIWDLRLLDGCPIHQIALSDLCHRCGKTLDWQNPCLFFCSRCQADLRTGTPRPLHDKAGSYVVGRLRGDGEPNPLLDKLPISKAMRVCERLGLVRLVGPVRTLPRQLARNLALARQLGFEMSERPVERFGAALDNIVRSARGGSGLTGTYGWIYSEWLGPMDSANGILNQVLLRHAIRHGVMSPAEERLGNQPATTIALKEAARRVGKGVEGVRRFMEGQRLIPNGSRRGVAFTIDPEALGQLARQAHQAVSVRTAALMLGTGKAQVCSLLPQAGPPEGPGRIDVKAIEALLAALESQSAETEAPPEAVPLGIAARNAAVPIARIVEAILGGSLKCWRGSASGLGRFMIRTKDAAAVRACKDFISVEAAARRLMVHHQCARALARSGAIHDDNGQITRPSIERFEAEFIAGSMLARQNHCSPMLVYNRLKTAGITPAFDLKTHRQAIFRRDDLIQTEFCQE